jgi:hypothetical protein
VFQKDLYYYIPSGVALDGRWAAVEKTEAWRGIGAPGIIDWFNILCDRLRILIAEDGVKKNVTPLLRANRAVSKAKSGKQE